MLGSARWRRRNSQPSITGIIRSSSTRRGRGSCRSWSKPVSPLGSRADTDSARVEQVHHHLAELTVVFDDEHNGHARVGWLYTEAELA